MSTVTLTFEENPIRIEMAGGAVLGGDIVAALNAANAPAADNPFVTEADEATALAAHMSAVDPHGDRVYAAAQDAAAITAHNAAIDPHGDRAYAASLSANYDAVGAAATAVSNHVSAVDPHGDRAYVDALLAANVLGGSTISDQLLKMWTESKAYEMLAVTYDGTYPSLITSATVQWPDGSAGVLTITATDTTKLVETAYTITHVASGKTVTQAAVTLNTYGFVTVKPALTVA